MLKTTLRILTLLLLGLLLWPELNRYRAELRLARANGALERIIRGVERGGAAVQAAEQAVADAAQAALWLPGDPRPALNESVALILLNRGAQAVALLDAAIAIGERPELSVNLGRARFISGDEAGAMQAYLRSAWANPGAVSSLPQELREQLLTQVAELESRLRGGQLVKPPALY